MLSSLQNEIKFGLFSRERRKIKKSLGGTLELSFEYKFWPTEYKIRRIPDKCSSLFNDPIEKTFIREGKDKPFIIGNTFRHLRYNKNKFHVHKCQAQIEI